MMQAVETLEKLGYTLTCHADGSIGIRGRPSPEADAALSVLRADKAGAAACLRLRVRWIYGRSALRGLAGAGTIGIGGIG